MKNIYIDGLNNDESTPIIRGIDLHLDKGEVLGLIGESGAGKSTLGLAAMGYTRQGCQITSGEIQFDGMDLRNAPSHVSREIRGNRISYVAQSAAASFNPAHRLISQYAEGPVVHGLMGRSQAEQEAVNIYQDLLLPDPENIGYRFPHQVSGGQLQRAMVAMAMACRPDIIVFDEPTTALDVTTQIEVLSAIREITRNYNTAAIYITHDLAVVAQIAHRIMVLRHGHLVEEGNTRELLKNPRKTYTRQLLSVRRSAQTTSPAPPEDEVLLEIKNVSARYSRRDKSVLEDISLKIKPGRTVALVGESGSGKSTLARVITGLLPPFRGLVTFQGETLPTSFRQRRRNQLRKMQMIYQMPDTALNPKQRIGKILGRPLSFYFGIKGSENKKKVTELLEMIELPGDYRHRFPGELSGGEKQRVCIARCLAARPDLVICDEVTSALDQLVAEEILNLLQRLQDELGVSYLFITHDLATVKVISDEIVVMRNGGIVEQGEREKILTPPHADYTKLLLSSVPKMDPDWLDGLLQERRAATA